VTSCSSTPRKRLGASTPPSAQPLASSRGRATPGDAHTQAASVSSVATGGGAPLLRVVDPFVWRCSRCVLVVDASTSTRIEERPRAESSSMNLPQHAGARTPTSSANKKERGSSGIITGAEGWGWRRHLRRRGKDLGSAKPALFVHIGAWWATEQRRGRPARRHHKKRDARQRGPSRRFRLGRRC
jgi:hypothetical protein